MKSIRDEIELLRHLLRNHPHVKERIHNGLHLVYFMGVGSEAIIHSGIYYYAGGALALVTLISLIEGGE